MEQLAWNIVGPILAVVMVVTGVIFAIKAAQALRDSDEGKIWKNAVIFFVCFGIAYKNKDVVQLLKDVWDKIPIIAGGG